MAPQIRWMVPVLALAGLALPGDVAAQEEPNTMVVDFQSSEGPEWFIVNDGVMGGRSQSSFRPMPEGGGRFAGYVSLENNGGFASMRARMDGSSLGSFDGVELLVRGDGRDYDFRLRTDGRFDGMAYRASFPTSEGEWQRVKIPFSAFQPTFRGWVPRNAPPLDPSAVRQMGFLVGGKQEGPFALEVQWIRAYSSTSANSDSHDN